MKIRKISAMFLIIALMISSFAIVPFNATEVVDLSTISAPQFAKSNQIYVLGTSASKEAWQCWESYESGVYSQEGVKYFFLPENTDRENIIIYNSYDSAVILNGVTVASNSAGSIPYVKGEAAVAVCNNETYKYIVLVSDADASIYVNDTTNDYTNDEGTHFTDFYEFIIDNKENSVKGSDVAVVSDDGLVETTLKKFKGRGNTNWKYSDKKQFNLTFEETMDIAGISDKKFSLINNERDGAVVRSKVVFDVANQVGLPYSSDTRYIDLYINGSYRGCFQISKKVEMGSKKLIALKDTSEDEGVVDNFNFAVEVDIWNAGSDTQFKSNYGQIVALNTPELEDYNPLDEVQLSQYNFIKNKYNEFETALYSGDMASLEKICNIESLAKAYLIQEWTKNCDGGLTSTYYTYKADEGKFYAVPVWDFDSGLGNVDCIRGGADISTVYPQGWLTKTLTNNNEKNGNTNTLGQAFKLSGKTSEGKTYLDYVTEIWEKDFIPAIKIVVGQASSDGGRLKSIDEYLEQYKNAFYNNYVQWGFVWGPEKGLGVSYGYSFEGQVNYLRDWTITRTNWITQELLGSQGEMLKAPDLTTSPSTELEANAEFYLCGTLDGVNDWYTRNYKMLINSERTKATYDLTLQKGLKYRFKIVKVIKNENTEYYVADYDSGVTAKYFVADTSTANLNVLATHTETVELTLVFDVSKGLFTAYHKGEAPTEPATTEPTETTLPTEEITTTDSTEATVPSQPTETTEFTEVTEATVATDPTVPTTKPQPVLNKNNLSLKAGATAMLAVANSTTMVKFKSNNSKIAKVNEYGVVTALKKGSTVVFAIVGNETLSCKITVTSDPKIKNGNKVVKNNSILKLKKGKKLTLKIIEKAPNISNDISIIGKGDFRVVGNKIIIKAKHKGTIKITAKLNGVKKYKFKVKIN